MYGTHWGVPGYTEVRELGTGAAGRVVLARRDHDGAEVAIKYLSDELRHDVGFVARFRHEARLLGAMRSPHNAQFIDYVETGDGAAIIMELVNGVPLRALLNSEGPTGPEAALCVLYGALKGLAAAHAIGVVHRDFKPENVVVQGDGTSKLIDFGIAVRQGDGANAAGTPPYMAPEQWSGAAASPSTDVYAATIVFFECLTGTRPFRASNIAALAHQHHSTPPPVEEVPAALQGLVERGMAKNPAERPPSAEAFLTELEAVAADAYGPDWQERGRRRLARLAGLLLVLFPSADDLPQDDATSLAETKLHGGGSKVMTKLGVKVLVGTVAVGVITGIAVVALSGSDEKPKLQAGTSTLTPSAVPPITGEPVTESPTPTEEETTPAPEETPTVEPTTTAAPPTVAPTSATPTVTPKPSKTPTVKPTPKPTKKPTESPEPGITSTADTDPTTPPTKSATPTPTPTPTTQSPTSRPTPTKSTGEPTEEPTGEESPPRGGESPTRTDNGESPTPESTPDPRRNPQVAMFPGAVLAAGLVTSGAVPVTLAVRRRMAGRHRRKR
ncbi:serine/threonine-protein kinase [Nonomuraea sp. NPDC050556]|uniref:serine/threonine-protein kinase n=1 Tax=Nonomuraea sp. NPDC050556 TaxID=3364369 RepID=UPI0037B3AC2A